MLVFLIEMINNITRAGAPKGYLCAKTNTVFKTKSCPGWARSSRIKSRPWQQGRDFDTMYQVWGIGAVG